MTKRHTESRHGGVLIGLVIAMVAVGVISAGMVRMLRSQAVTASHAYNQMRARYAADSGQSYIDNISYDELLAYAHHPASEFLLANGDRFILKATDQTAYIRYEIEGRMLNNAEVVSSRLLKGSKSRGGSSTLPDGEPPDVTGETGTQVDETDSMPDANIIGTVIPDADSENEHINLMPSGKGNWRKTYNHVLDLHQGFKIENLPIRGSATSLKLRTDLNIRYAEVDPADSNHMIWSVALPFDYLTQATAAREANSGWLAYEVQTKISWQLDENNYDRVSGAQGIAFKLHGTSAADYQFYAVTVMRYLNQNESNNMITDYDDLNIHVIDGWNRVDGYWGLYDCIPNDIKPPGKQNRYLLVLWKQWLDGNGDIQRTWLVSQDLNSEQDFITEWYGMQDVTIHLRVKEGQDSGGEFVDVQILLGDALSWNSGGYWAPHNSPYDRRWNRWDYPNASESGSPFVIWPPLDYADWNTSVDYYTITEETANVTVNGTTAQFLNDGITIRLYDSDYLSKNQTNQRGDIGLIFCGNFLTGLNHNGLQNNGKLKNGWNYDEVDIPSLYMAADDFALRWLTTESPDGTGADGESVITDF
jgi:hypothetical protein